MTTNHSSITVYQTEIRPGEHKVLSLPMPNLYDCTPISMPVHVIHGKHPGPVIGVCAAIHGDEINGIEIVRRLIKKISSKKLHGTIIAIPIVNVFGFLYQDRYLMDRRDLNRAFPGSQKGSLASRLAHMISKEIMSHCSHFIDLHTGSLHRSNLPQIRANLDSSVITRLAKAFNPPVIIHASLRDGSLRQYAKDQSIPFLLYEAGESLRFDELSIRLGLKGILGVMQELKMLVEKKVISKKLTPTISRATYWVRAPRSGILHRYKTLGKMIKKGEMLAKIGNPTTTEEFKLLSPLSGIIIGENNLPMVHEGAALFHVASFQKLKLVEEHIDILQESIIDNPTDWDNT